MRANDGTRTAAEVLIDQLVLHGAQHVFCRFGVVFGAAQQDIGEAAQRGERRAQFVRGVSHKLAHVLFGFLLSG